MSTFNNQRTSHRRHRKSLKRLYRLNLIAICRVIHLVASALIFLTGCSDGRWETIELGNPPLRVSVTGKARRIADIQLPPIAVAREYYEAEQKKLNPWVFTTLDFVQAPVGHSFDAHDSALEYARSLNSQPNTQVETFNLKREARDRIFFEGYLLSQEKTKKLRVVFRGLCIVKDERRWIISASGLAGEADGHCNTTVR